MGSEADKLTLSHFLAEVYTEWTRRKGGSPQQTHPSRLARSLVEQLDKIEYWGRVVGEIDRACTMAESWGGSYWAERCKEAREVVAGYRETPNHVPETVTDEEAVLWERYTSRWDATATTAEREGAKLREQMSRFLGQCERDPGRTLEEFLASFPCRVRESPWD